MRWCLFWGQDSGSGSWRGMRGWNSPSQTSLLTEFLVFTSPWVLDLLIFFPFPAPLQRPWSPLQWHHSCDYTAFGGLERFRGDGENSKLHGRSFLKTMKKRSATITLMSLGKSARIYLKHSSKFQSAPLYLGTEKQNASWHLFPKGECPQLHIMKFSVSSEEPGGSLITSGQQKILWQYRNVEYNLKYF